MTLAVVGPLDSKSHMYVGSLALGCPENYLYLDVLYRKLYSSKCVITNPNIPHLQIGLKPIDPNLLGHPSNCLLFTVWFIPKRYAGNHAANWHPNGPRSCQTWQLLLFFGPKKHPRPMWSATATAPSLGIYVSKSRKRLFHKGFVWGFFGGNKWCIFMKSKGILGLNLGMFKRMFKRKALKNWISLRQFFTGFEKFLKWLVKSC